MSLYQLYILGFFATLANLSKYLTNSNSFSHGVYLFKYEKKSFKGEKSFCVHHFSKNSLKPIRSLYKSNMMCVCLCVCTKGSY